MNTLMTLSLALGLLAAPAVDSDVPVLQPASAGIQEVTVYPDQARVTRKTSVNLPPGQSVVVFKGLTAGLDAASLRARVTDGRAKVTGLSAEWEGSTEPKREEEAELTKKIEELSAKIVAQNDRRAALQLRQKLLNQYRAHSQNAMGKGASGSSVSTARWNSALAYLTKEQEKIASEQRDIQQKINDLNEELNARRADLNKLRAPSSTRQRNVEVVLSSTRGTRIELALDYVVYDAWWAPAYDVRENGEKLELTYYGTVTQGTGEDWEGVGLTLSTARPSESAQVPELSPVRLSGYEREKQPVTIVSYGKKAEKLDKKDIGLKQPQQGGEGRAVVDDHGTAVTFQIRGAESIPADRRPHKVQVTSSELDASLTYEAIPKIAPWVYRKATVSNSTPFPILAGKVDVFRSSGYIGTGSLDYVATGEEFSVSLGVDEDLKIRRIVDEKVARKPKLLANKSRITHAYDIEVSNYKDTPREITIVENIPVSQRKEIEVSLGEKTTKPTETDDDGFVRWTLKLDPQQTRDIYFTYQIEYPKEFRISGL